MTDIVEELFRTIIKDTKIKEDRIDWLALSLREAVNNAIIHGNKKDKSKNVEIEFIFFSDNLTIKVWDEGEGFNINALDDPTKEENLLKPHGRGIFLIQRFVDETKFICRNEGFGIELKIKY